jgi:hypothetical protein
MWKAVGEPEGKRPSKWSDGQGAKEFISFISDLENIPREDILKTTRGRAGKTWAHWQIGLAYAKTLDHRLHAEVNATFRAVKEAEDQRARSRQRRKEYASIIAKHGVTCGGKRNGFAECTNALYTALWGGPASVIREKRGFAASQNLREKMGSVALATVALGEAMAGERIEEMRLWGIDDCAAATHTAGTFAKKAVVEERVSRKVISAPDVDMTI